MQHCTGGLASTLRYEKEKTWMKQQGLLQYKQSVGEGSWRHSPGGNLKPTSIAQQTLKAGREEVRGRPKKLEKQFPSLPFSNDLTTR